MIKTTDKMYYKNLPKEFIDEIAQIALKNIELLPEKEADIVNKALLDIYGIPNINGDFLYSEIDGFFNLDTLKSLQEDDIVGTASSIEELNRMLLEDD